MSLVKGLIPLSLLSLCATHTSFVLANNDIVPFIGLGGGYQWADDDDYSSSKPRGGIYNIYGGLQFTENWSWDLGYQYHNNLYAKATQIDVNTYLINTAVRYDWYLNQDISLFGRLGVSYWNLEKNSPNNPQIDEDGISPLLETGLAYHVTDNIALNVSYQYVNSIGNDHSGEYDSHAAMMNLTYYFGSNNNEVAPVVAAAPIAAAVVAEQTETVTPSYTITSNYGFDFASSQVSESSTNTLSETAKGIIQESPQQVQVVGHTDSIGSRSFNQTLSEKRAQSVADILTENGVNADTVVITGKGEDEPKASNDTEEGRAQNRRVEIYLK